MAAMLHKILNKFTSDLGGEFLVRKYPLNFRIFLCPQERLTSPGKFPKGREGG